MTSEQFAAYWDWYLEHDAKRRASTSKGTLEREPWDRPTISAGELDETHDPIRGAVRRGACTQRTSAVAGEFGDRVHIVPLSEVTDEVISRDSAAIVIVPDEEYEEALAACAG